MNIGLIPARGGSKGIHRKNICLLDGMPLIAWSIIAAKKSSNIDQVYVSTDDNEIAEISIKYGAKIITRPISLAEDSTPTDPVIEHAITTLMNDGVNVTNICLLQPTSPLRTEKHINDAFEVFKTKNADCVISVFENKNCIAKAYQLNNDGVLVGLFNENAPYSRRQDLPKTFQPNGAIYLFSKKSFIEKNKIPRSKAFPLIMMENESIDIDTIDDLNLIKDKINKDRLIKNPSFEIGGRKVGLDYDPLVIAEIGINHGGSLDVAYEMVDAAIQAGAEIIKHQTHIIEDEMSSDAKTVIPGNASISIYEIMKKCALSENDELKLKEYVESKGAIFISTPFSRAAVFRLEKMGVKAYKIGSGECNNYPLIELIASLGKPVILSTGMNNIDSVKKSVSIIKKYNIPYCLLHCTNIYPTPDSLIRLGAIEELQREFPEAVVGLSDHSIDNLACLGAVAVGASVLERHFTDRKDRIGPDIMCSMDINECSDLIKQSKRMKSMRGGSKELINEEKITSDFAYASVVTISPIKKGEKFDDKNLWVKRPGTGDFLAKDFYSLLGKIASMDIATDIQLKKEHIEHE